MQSKAKNVSDYLKEVPEDRAPYFKKLRDTVAKIFRKDLKSACNMA